MAHIFVFADLRLYGPIGMAAKYTKRTSWFLYVVHVCKAYYNN